MQREKEKDNYEDDRLKSLLKAGDEQAYKFIYDKYSRRMFRFGCQFTDDREEILDIIHDTFVSLYRHRDRLDDIVKLRSYMFRSLRNGLLNSIKRKKILNEKLLAREEFDHPEENPEIAMIERENDVSKSAVLNSIMKILTPNQKEVIFYRYVENMTIDEIASVMNINYQSVQNLIQRSLKKARKHLGSIR